ncbi:MAG: phytanoyl-CoA dioxygenase family protein [Actinobacteria bacterium]|jgi:ectoine hydroxylase-related dioxygenase (phytanoyl-CoA dioxygenase family)|nr:phytanoyl-CoA dioxygenase family protein [Actinomycetota bacterium]
MADVWLSAGDCRLSDLLEVTSTPTVLTDYPHASEVVDGVVVYEREHIGDALVGHRRELQAEIVSVLLDGPGIAVFTGAFDDISVIDSATGVFNEIIAEQQAAGGAAGDHFGRPGANDRIWNALEKLAVRAPDLFVRYYANDIIASVSQAWLGPGYQVTSQVNVVNPGGAAQQVHRDYHLGFQSNEVAEDFPAHAHRLSPLLTLQGAVAHCDMPIESGPTLYLPHSQKYGLGYLAWRLPEFRDHFASHHVQLPLAKGDIVFFNPALFHAAGTNRSTDIRRMANLLQVSSPFGRAMESIDREGLVAAIYDDLRKAHVTEGRDRRDVDNVIAASAEGYSFPTNLDRDQPVGGLAPMTQAAIVTLALDEDWDHATLVKALADQVERTRTH